VLVGILLQQRCSPSYMCWCVFYYNNAAYPVICVGEYFITTTILTQLYLLVGILLQQRCSPILCVGWDFITTLLT